MSKSKINEDLPITWENIPNDYVFSLGGGMRCLNCGTGYYDGYARSKPSLSICDLTMPCNSCGDQQPAEMTKAEMIPFKEAQRKKWEVMSHEEKMRYIGYKT